MLVSRTYYIWNSDSRDLRDLEPEVSYYEQPVKDVVIYHIMTWWYKLLDQEPLRRWICKHAKKKSELPRDCGLEHDCANEPDICWWVCPCVDRDLKIHNYENKNAVKIDEV
jgi:hypothetical protein